MWSHNRCELQPDETNERFRILVFQEADDEYIADIKALLNYNKPDVLLPPNPLF